MKQQTMYHQKAQGVEDLAVNTFLLNTYINNGKHITAYGLLQIIIKTYADTQGVLLLYLGINL